MLQASSLPAIHHEWGVGILDPLVLEVLESANKLLIKTEESRLLCEAALKESQAAIDRSIKDLRREVPDALLGGFRAKPF